MVSPVAWHFGLQSCESRVEQDLSPQPHGVPAGQSIHRVLGFARVPGVADLTWKWETEVERGQLVAAWLGIVPQCVGARPSLAPRGQQTALPRHLVLRGHGGGCSLAGGCWHTSFQLE